MTSDNNYYDQLCDALRDIEDTAEEGDELFYCSYLLGLLGIQAGAIDDSVDKASFNSHFVQTLSNTMQQEKLSVEDQKAITRLWEKIQCS